MEKKKRIVIALGGNALGNTLPEQMAAVKITEIFLAFITLFLLFFFSLYHISQDSFYQ